MEPSVCIHVAQPNVSTALSALLTLDERGASEHFFFSTCVNGLGARGVAGDDAVVDGRLVAPAPLIAAADPVAFPGPEEPAASVALVRLRLGGPCHHPESAIS